MIVTIGWRMTCVIGGLGTWFIGLPLIYFLVKPHRPEYYGLLPDGATAEQATADTSQMIEKGVRYAAGAEEVEFTLRQTLRTPTYWLIIISGAFQGLATPAFNVHAIPFLTDRGIAPTAAAGILSIMVAASLPVRLIGGVLADRVQKQHLRFLQAGSYLIQAIGFACFLLHQTMAMVYVWFILYGIGNGAGYGINSPIRARYFGRKAFGSIGGLSSLFMLPVGVAGPIYLGWVYDTTGSYINGFVLVTLLVTLATVIVSFALPPKPPATVTDIRKIL